jgi:hypothetical protein
MNQRIVLSLVTGTFVIGLAVLDWRWAIQRVDVSP